MGKRNKKRVRRHEVTESIEAEDPSVVHGKKIQLVPELHELADEEQDEVQCSMTVTPSIPEDPVALAGDDFMSLLDVQGSSASGVKTTDSAIISCPGDSVMMKTDIFDPSYDMPNMLSSGAEDDLGLLNGMDPSGALTIRHDSLDDTLQVIGDRDHIIHGSMLNTVPGIFPLAMAPVGEVPMHMSLPVATPLAQPSTLPISLINTTASGDLATGDGLHNAVLGSPVVLPNSGPFNGTLAQIAKIEAGADGKGYVLHLNIPSMAGGQIISPQGMPLMAPNSRLVLANMTPVVLPQVAIHSSEAELAVDPLADTGECVEVDVEGDCSPLHYDTHTAEALVDQPDSLSNGEVDVSGSDEERIKEEVEEEVLDDQTESMSSMVEDGSQVYVTEDEEQADGDAQGSTSAGGSSYEDPDVVRFVICSDGPMECVLCSFKTDSYSAFKSHIICSHPCWRITKKLSKNRLLVEKSVKMNVNIVQPTLPLAQLQKALVKKTEGDLIKSQKSNSQSTRRKQLIERNKRLFKCSKCWRLFVFEGSIVNHLLDYHLAKKPYDFIQVSNDHGQTFGLIHRCPYKNCFVSCASLEELQRHRGESHAQYVFRCQICGFTADSTEAVKEHAAKIHHEQVMQFGPMD